MSRRGEALHRKHASVRLQEPRLLDLLLLQIRVVVCEVHSCLLVLNFPRRVRQLLGDQALVDVLFDVLGIGHDVQAAEASRLEHLLIHNFLPPKNLLEYLASIQFPVGIVRRGQHRFGLLRPDGVSQQERAEKLQLAVPPPRGKLPADMREATSVEMSGLHSVESHPPVVVYFPGRARVLLLEPIRALDA